jgi:glycosyltransferase involved in cell wall biosynthesis
VGQLDRGRARRLSHGGSLIVGKPSLVVVSPLPPAWSGIAQYTAGLLPHLTERWRVSVVVGDGEPVDQAIGPELGIDIVHASSWRWFEQITDHDRILHCLGNSQFHRHVPEMIGVHGGVVLAHEVRMNGLQCLRALQQPDPHWLSAMVEERHGPALASEIRALEDDGGIAHQFHPIRTRLDRAGTYLFGPAVIGADAVAFHSQYAASLAEAEVPSSVARHVVPFGHPAVAHADRRSEEPGELITTFGFVAPEKHMALLLEAFAVLAADRRDARLRYAGHVGDPERQELMQRARQLGVDDRVSFTGRLSEHDYARELSRATIAVQLRASANGEASAAIADCLSQGLPTLVTQLGAQAELPPDAVEMVSASADAHEIAAAMAKVLANPARREQMKAAARRHATQSSFASAADALTELLQSAPPTR